MRADPVGHLLEELGRRAAAHAGAGAELGTVTAIDPIRVRLDSGPEVDDPVFLQPTGTVAGGGSPVLPADGGGLRMTARADLGRTGVMAVSPTGRALLLTRLDDSYSLMVRATQASPAPARGVVQLVRHPPTAPATLEAGPEVEFTTGQAYSVTSHGGGGHTINTFGSPLAYGAAGVWASQVSTTRAYLFWQPSPGTWGTYLFARRVDRVGDALELGPICAITSPIGGNFKTALFSPSDLMIVHGGLGFCTGVLDETYFGADYFGVTSFSGISMNQALEPIGGGRLLLVGTSGSSSYQVLAKVLTMPAPPTLVESSSASIGFFDPCPFVNRFRDTAQFLGGSDWFLAFGTIGALGAKVHTRKLTIPGTTAPVVANFGGPEAIGPHAAVALISPAWYAAIGSPAARRVAVATNTPPVGYLDLTTSEGYVPVLPVDAVYAGRSRVLVAASPGSFAQDPSLYLIESAPLGGVVAGGSAALIVGDRVACAPIQGGHDYAVLYRTRREGE